MNKLSKKRGTLLHKIGVTTLFEGKFNCNTYKAKKKKKKHLVSSYSNEKAEKHAFIMPFPLIILTFPLLTTSQYVQYKIQNKIGIKVAKFQPIFTWEESHSVAN